MANAIVHKVHGNCFLCEPAGGLNASIIRMLPATPKTIVAASCGMPNRGALNANTTDPITIVRVRHATSLPIVPSIAATDTNSDNAVDDDPN
jgi:hypothetical protein